MRIPGAINVSRDSIEMRTIPQGIDPDMLVRFLELKIMCECWEKFGEQVRKLGRKAREEHREVSRLHRYRREVDTRILAVMKEFPRLFPERFWPTLRPVQVEERVSR